MDFKKIVSYFLLLLLFSSCNWFGEDLTDEYSGEWYIINKTNHCIKLKQWYKGKSFFYAKYRDIPFVQLVDNERMSLFLLGSDENVSFSQLRIHLDTLKYSFMKCDSITFESCDGSEVYHVWHTTGVDNGEPFYQEENWRYESKDNGYTNCWYYTLTSEFVAE